MSADSLSMMPWFPRDFIASTLGWRLLERALYHCLLDAQWELGALPDDEEELARIAGATKSEFDAAWPRVKAKFRSTASGSLQNARLEEHRRKALEIRDKKRRAGRAGGIASGKARSTAEADSKAELQAQEGHSAEANVQAKTKPPSPSPSEDEDSVLRTVVASATPAGLLNGKFQTLESEILAAYHEILPELPRVRNWNDRRRKKLKARIRERLKLGKKADSVDYWRDFFGVVAASDFLMGRKTDWQCPGLEWLLEPKHFDKTTEGGYSNRGNSNGRS